MPISISVSAITHCKEGNPITNSAPSKAEDLFSVSQCNEPIAILPLPTALIMSFNRVLHSCLDKSYILELT